MTLYVNIPWGNHGDYALFVSATLMVLMGIQRVFLRRLRHPMITWFVWSISIITMVGGWFMVNERGLNEQSHYLSMLEGFAPTFANEMQELGHEKMGPSTTPNDPAYLTIIEAEKQWLRINPDVQNIYTFRTSGDGKTAQLIVDSETDYNHDNRFDGAKEARASIGQEFRPDPVMVKRALSGKLAFSEQVTNDEAGSWISSYFPIHSSSGMVEAILGVDFDASEWRAARSYARWTAIGYISAVLFGALALAAGLSAWMLAKENALQRRQTAELEVQRRKLETLVNSIDGVVMEWDPASDVYVFVSKQAGGLLGYPEDEWRLKRGFWQSHILHEDSEYARAQRQQAVNSRHEFNYEYRMVSADGRTVWIQERGAVVQESGRPVLLRGVMTDISRQKESSEELERLNKELVESSRHAGMAEVASGVLHNVGNVLNSVNVSSTLIGETLSQTKLPTLKRISELLCSQQKSLPEFFASDPRGAAIPRLMGELHHELENENEKLAAEAKLLVKNISHIREIIGMQQNFAKTGGNTESFPVEELIDDAVRINESGFSRHGIKIVRKYGETPPVLGDRSRVLQVLVNLVGNARHALTESHGEEKILTLGLTSDGPDKVKITVQDNGIGIPAERLPQLFVYGFTTKKDGHGFGLHSCAKAARDMGGSLSVNSEGEGRGAIFTLDLPLMPPDPAVEL
jgi:PAS domain S-box-containing protein